jgi:hypothetical protein
MMPLPGLPGGEPLEPRRPFRLEDLGATVRPPELSADEELRTRPPAVARIRASHRVPYGRSYRQWNTRGELEVWANRGELADLPRRRGPYGVNVLVTELVPPGLIGIPVYNE